MKKNSVVAVEDNGAAFLVVVNPGTDERLVVNAFSCLASAWEHIEWMYKIESQEFLVKGRKLVPVAEWVDGMKKAGFLD